MVRFLAAFAVLACHMRGAFFVEYTLLQPEQQTPLMFVFYSLTRLGHEAVLIFFVLSGFLVGGKAIERIRSNTFNIRSYAIDRTVRIMLPLLSAIVLEVIVRQINNKETEVTALVGNIFSLQGILCKPYIAVLWSLSYEVWFYILLCAFACCILNARRAKGYIGLIVLFICFMIFSKLKAYYLFVWLLGAFGFLFVGKSSRCVTYASALALIGLICALQLTSGSRFCGVHTENVRPYIELPFGLMASLFITQIVNYRPSSNMAIKLNNIGTRLAAFSYTLYLVHVPIISLLIYFGVPKSETVNMYSVSLYIAWMLISIVASYLLYLIFERNTGKVKGWIKKKLNVC